MKKAKFKFCRSSKKTSRVETSRIYSIIFLILFLLIPGYCFAASLQMKMPDSPERAQVIQRNNLRPILVTVPDITNLTLQKASLRLRNLGLLVKVTSHVFHPSVENNHVISQNPLPKTTVLPKSTITVLLSKGPAPMPDLTGENLREAIEILKGKTRYNHVDYSPYHLTVKKKYVLSSHTRDIILRQIPNSGQPLKPEETVILYVSKGIANKRTGLVATPKPQTASIKHTKPNATITQYPIRTNTPQKTVLPAPELHRIRLCQTRIHQGESLKLSIKEKKSIKYNTFYIGRKKVSPKTTRHSNDILLPTEGLSPGEYPVLVHHGRNWEKIGTIRILKTAHTETRMLSPLKTQKPPAIATRSHVASFHPKPNTQIRKTKPPKPAEISKTSKKRLSTSQETKSSQHQSEKKIKSFVLSVDAEKYPQLKKILVKNSTWIKIEKKQFIKSLNQVLIAVKTTDPGKVKRLAKGLTTKKFIRAFQPNHTYRTYGSSTDPYISRQFGCLPAEKLRDIQKICDGKNVRIALLDTGVDTRHEDLNAKRIIPVDFTNEGWGRYYTDIHGTALCGILSAIPGNGRGIAGLAPGAEIFAIKVCRSIKPGAIEAITDTFTLASGLDYVIQKRIKLVNISIGGPKDPLIERLIGKARIRGTVFVAAVGNGGPRAPPSYPAAYPGVIGVTAVDQNFRLYSRAPWGPFVDVSAPGVDVFSLKPGNRYNFYTGTSFATAYVTGILALQYSCTNTHLNENSWHSFLEKVAFKPLTFSPERFGLGILILSKIPKSIFTQMNFSGKNITN